MTLRFLRAPTPEASTMLARVPSDPDAFGDFYERYAERLGK